MQKCSHKIQLLWYGQYAGFPITVARDLTQNTQSPALSDSTINGIKKSQIPHFVTSGKHR